MKKVFSFVIIICVLCVNVAFLNIDASAGNPVVPAGYGFWDFGFEGVRFSLVDKNGVTRRIVDVFNFDQKETVSIGNNIGNVLTGNIVNTGNYSSDGAYIVFRTFNRCKTDISQDSGYNPKYAYKSLSDLPIKSSPVSIDTFVKDNWYIMDSDNAFVHSPLGNRNFNATVLASTANGYELATYNPSTHVFGYSSGQSEYNSVYEFLHNTVIGNGQDAISSETPWLCMCDVLNILGLDVYNGVYFSGGYLDAANKTKLYNNLLNTFVVNDYCVVVEPMVFVPILLWDEKRVNGVTYTYRHHVSVYYGSASELGMFQSQLGNSALDDEDRGYGCIINGTQYTVDEIRMNNVLRGLLPKAAFVDDEYKFALKKYSNNTLSTINITDWDYLGWKGEKPTVDCLEIGRIDNKYWKLAGYGTYHAYNAEFIKNFACGMCMITSSDFIKPQIETYDSEYRTDTNVVTAIKVSNRSDTAYTTTLDSTSITSNSALNTNSVPKAMLCKFTVSKISDSTGDYGRWTADRSDITTQYKQKLEELGFAKDADGNYITEFYGSLDGIMPREFSDAQPTCYVSFNWKTPEKPCKVTFEVEFQNANTDSEAVLGTAEHNGLRATEIKTDYGLYTTEFYCDIVEGDNTTYFTEATVPPDSVSIISVAPNAAEGTEEQKLYKLNHDIYDAYQAAHGTTPAVYTGTDFAGKTIVDSQSWSEYVASYDASNNIVLTHKPHTVSIGLTKTTDDTYTDSTSKILRTDQSGLYSDYADTIGSGYGIGVDFISSYSNDEAGVDYVRDVTVNGVTYQNSLVTNYDHGVVMFPEYSYQTYYGEMLQFDTDVDLVGRSAERRFMLPANKDSKFYDDSIERPAGMNDEEYAEYVEQNNSEKSRVHFTPVWYPDGTYQIVLCMFDAWTPAGQLWFYKTYNIEIKGSIYDTWYVTRTYKNQVTS